MPTDFSFEHVFRAPSVMSLVDAYFDEDHNATQDALAKLVDRTIVEEVDGEVRRKLWRVTSTKVLPVIARPFVKGGKLQFLESCTWKKGDSHVDTTISPDVLGGRVQIVGAYVLRQLGDNRIHRTFRGEITAALALVGGKIERGIRDEFAEQCPRMADCTQGWLDRKLGA